MFDFLFHWRSSTEPPHPVDIVHPHGPPRVLSKAKWKKREVQLNTSLISFPVPSTVGLDDSTSYWQHPRPSPNRARPSNVAWLRHTGAEDGEELPRIPNLPSGVSEQNTSYLHTIGRSVSSPPTSSSYVSSSSSSVATPPWNLQLHASPRYSQSTHSLRLDIRHTFATDPYGYATSYPLARQLSPIAEKDYVSPVSLQQSNPLPPASDHHSSTSIFCSRTSLSPPGSQISDITRPSPVYSHPFISRPLNRTVSQTSSRTHVSTTSSTWCLPTKSSATKLSATKSSPTTPSPPPSIPPLDLRPPFPGPHPSYSGIGPPLRPPKATTIPTMPTIADRSQGSIAEEFDGGDDDDMGSLHAESFVTASDSMPGGAPTDRDIIDVELGNPLYQSSQAEPSSLPSVDTSQSLSSTSDSFIRRRWDRDASFGTGVVTFKVKRQWMSLSPAFWTFWLGFAFPPLWLVGGWHFTNFGEQPPRLTFWEFYFNAGYWAGTVCCWRKKVEKEKDPPLPQWVREKQGSESRRARLNDPKRSLRGISFGYPFVPRPIMAPGTEGRCARVLREVLRVLGKPNRLLDRIYSLKITEVRGRPESSRRMFDPWIQRCRYAFCYVLILLCLGLFTSSAYLIIYYTRRLSRRHATL